MRKFYIDTPHGQVHLRRVAGRGTPFVLLHRTPVDSACFTAMLALLAQRGCAAIALDTPGFGQSFRPSGHPTAADYAGWLLAALDGLGVDDFHLCGHHTGTHIAVELALLAGIRARSLLLNGVLYADAAERADIRAQVGDAPPVDADGAYLLKTWYIVKNFFPGFPSDLVHTELVGALATAESRNQAFGAILAQDFAATLARVSCPVAVTQALDDPLAGYLSRVTDAHPHIPIILHGSAGIAAPELQPRAFTAALIAFATAVEAASVPLRSPMENRRFTLAKADSRFTLEQASAPIPIPGPGEVQVRVHAVSINRRDIMILKGQGYPVGAANHFVPGSDAAGIVTAVGPDVTAVKVGDRVCSTFFQNWPDGRISFAALASALGAGGAGVMADHILLSENGVTALPDGWSFEAGAALPCAGVTAWSALKGMRKDDWVLIQGTGGVALFGLQIAVAVGAKPIVISSSDDKLARVRTLGAVDTVNYIRQPDWDLDVQRITGGGAHHVLELGGAGTLARSIRAAAPGGRVALVGGLDGFGGEISAADLVMGVKTVGAVSVGSRADQLDLTGFMVRHGITPIIDHVLPADQLAQAYDRAEIGAFGKVVVTFA